MDYTQNLHLPQWEASDRIHHDDFNDAMAKIDAAMPRIATGTYAGNAVSTGQTVTVSFPIRAVFIWRNSSDNNGGGLWPHAALCVSGTNYALDIVKISGSSFTVKNATGSYPELNTNYLTYNYIVFG